MRKRGHRHFDGRDATQDFGFGLGDFGGARRQRAVALCQRIEFGFERRSLVRSGLHHPLELGGRGAAGIQWGGRAAVLTLESRQFLAQLAQACGTGFENRTEARRLVPMRRFGFEHRLGLLQQRQQGLTHGVTGRTLLHLGEVG